MTIRSFAQLAAAAALKTEQREVMGHNVIVRELSLGDRMAFIEAVSADKNSGAVFLVRHGLMDSSNTPMVKTDEEAAELKTLSPDFVQAIATQVLEISGMSQKPVPPKND